jgi:hypothetical protein
MSDQVDRHAGRSAGDVVEHREEPQTGGLDVAQRVGGCIGVGRDRPVQRAARAAAAAPAVGGVGDAAPGI